ncbi:MAG: hypothetical protein ACU0BB_12810 [Paracoccaceae bacterium]
MDSYSRIVAFLKVLLPLAALALLSTLFLISGGRDTETKIPFAEHEIDERLRGQQVTKPFFSGTTAQGDEIMVSAARARPGSTDAPADADDFQGRIRMVDGGEITMRSDTGHLLLDTDVVSFIGNVVIMTSTGLTVNTERLNSALNGVAGTSPGAITGTGVFGDFEAGSMQFSTKSAGGPVHMLFNKDVKLIYVPKKPER